MNQALTQAWQALQRGERELARRIVAAQLHANTADVAAWMMMSELAENQQQKRDCLERALKIDPANKHAQQALHQLNPPEPAMGATIRMPAESKPETAATMWAAAQPLDPITELIMPWEQAGAEQHQFIIPGKEPAPAPASQVAVVAPPPQAPAAPAINPQFDPHSLWLPSPEDFQAGRVSVRDVVHIKAPPLPAAKKDRVAMSWAAILFIVSIFFLLVAIALFALL